jgi:penicillin-binding protein 1C
LGSKCYVGGFAKCTELNSYPGKNQQKLRLKETDFIEITRRCTDSQTYTLSIAEPLPQKPYDLLLRLHPILQKSSENARGTCKKQQLNELQK